MEGKAPACGLETIFRNFARWLNAMEMGAAAELAKLDEC